MSETVVFEFSVGEEVTDDLTFKRVRVIGISYANGYINNDKLLNNAKCIGYWVDDPHLDGGRHPWELSKI